MCDQLIPLSVLALDLDVTAERLATQLRDRVLLDHLGRKAIDAEVACQLISSHHAAQADAAAARQRQRTACDAVIVPQLEATQQRVAALAERDRRLRDGDTDLSTFERIHADDDTDRRGRSGRRFDDLFEANRQGHIGAGYTFSPPPKG
jgi:hypothetical protein